MELSRALAVKLLQLANGERLPASSLKSTFVAELLAEGILADSRKGRTQSTLYVPDPLALHAFLFNRFAIADLAAYTEVFNQEEQSRAVFARHAADSKLRRTRTFKGFLVNSYQQVPTVLNGQKMLIHPPNGTFQFIHDYATFIPAPEVVIVNVENSENFSQIARQKSLFQDILPLFVSRYPQNQSQDLLKWLQGLPNSYLHYGDFDFAGINIYLSEYKKSLGQRAKFYIPAGIEEIIIKYGNPKLYDRQKANFHLKDIDEPGIHHLVTQFHRYKKCLEQEVLISGTKFS